ncbi:hypothetical protein KKF05_04780 [Patescibacteria group bacterium]|nr:hypothetical protein [Patescibacteria group bacterium]
MADTGESLFLRLFRGADEAMNPVLDRVAERIATMVTDQRAVQALVGRLNPATLAAIKHAGPVAMGGAVGFFLPDSLFGSPQQANAVKNFIVRFMTKFADAFERNGRAMPAVAAEVDVMVNELLAEELVMDQFDHVHEATCPKMLRAGGRRTRVTMAKAIERELLPSPCCAAWLQKRLEKPAGAAAKKPAVPIRSAFDAIAALEDEADQDLVLGWVAKLSAKQLETLSVHLDSAAEARVLVRCLKAGFPAVKTLRLLENQSSRTIVRREVASAVGAVKDTVVAAGEQVADAVKGVAGQVDDGLEPLADTLEQLETEVKQRTARLRPSLWQRLKNMVSL